MYSHSNIKPGSLYPHNPPLNTRRGAGTQSANTLKSFSREASQHEHRTCVNHYLTHSWNGWPTRTLTLGVRGKGKVRARAAPGTLTLWYQVLRPLLLHTPLLPPHPATTSPPRAVYSTPQGFGASTPSSSSTLTVWYQGEGEMEEEGEEACTGLPWNPVSLVPRGG